MGDNGVYVAIKNITDNISSGSLGILRVCGWVIVAIMATVAILSIYGEVRAAVLHEAPNELDGVKSFSTKKTLAVDIVMLAVACIITVALL